MMVGAETILELLDHLEKPGGFSPNRRKILRLMAGAIGFYGADWCCAWLYLKKKALNEQVSINFTEILWITLLNIK